MPFTYGHTERNPNAARLTKAQAVGLGLLALGAVVIGNRIHEIAESERVPPLTRGYTVQANDTSITQILRDEADTGSPAVIDAVAGQPAFQDSVLMPGEHLQIPEADPNADNQQADG